MPEVTDVSRTKSAAGEVASATAEMTAAKSAAEVTSTATEMAAPHMAAAKATPHMAAATATPHMAAATATCQRVGRNCRASQRDGNHYHRDFMQHGFFHWTAFLQT